jgi:hypothetical protein
MTLDLSHLHPSYVPPRPPEYLYKYRSLRDGEARTFTHRLLTHAEVYFARPSELDDPSEFTIDVVIGEPSELHGDALIDLIAPVVPREEGKILVDTMRRFHGGIPRGFFDQILLAAKQKLYKMRDDWGIFSTSARGDLSSMWAHYADSHRGICVQFKVDSGEWFEPWPVIYQDQCPVWDVCKNDLRTTLDYWVRTKHCEWEMQDEWRIFNKPGVSIVPEYLMTGIVFGCRTSHRDREKVVEWVSQSSHPIRLYQAKQQDFDLVVEPFTS